jgi:hypothetical protein
MTAVSLPRSRLMVSPRLRMSASSRMSSWTSVARWDEFADRSDRWQRLASRSRRHRFRCRCRHAADDHERRPQHLAPVALDVLAQPLHRREIASKLALDADHDLRQSLIDLLS